MKLFKIFLEKNKKITLLFLIFLLIIIYFIGAQFYSKRFLPGTYVGNWSLDGKTITTAQAYIKKSMKDYRITFQEEEKDLGFVTLDQLNITLVNNEILQDTLDNQNGFHWPIRLFTHEEIPMDKIIHADEALIGGLIDAIVPDNDNRTPMKNAHFIEKNGEFEIVPEIYGNQLTVKSFEKSILDAFSNKSHQLHLEEAYEKPTLLANSHDLDSVMNEIIAMQETQVTLLIDNQEVKIPQETIQAWITVDEEGQPIAQRSLISDYVGNLNTEFSGLLNPHLFHSYYFGEVYVQPGTYGWYMDVDYVADEIADHIEARTDSIFEPTISGSGYGQIGNPSDYVEVDLTNQMMFIVRNNELILETPIVSGQETVATIPGAYEVWQMLADTDLVGYDPIAERDYKIPVDFWVAFDYTGQGIHDASWQSTFGGDTYLHSGSLGCINTPPARMGDVFESIFIGMPVFIY